MKMSRETEESETGEVGAESRELPRGRVLPLNSKRLTTTHLKQVAEKLELPTTTSADQIRQLIEGKLQEDREVSNVQVVQESTYCELKLSLINEEGVFLETDPTAKSVESVTSELEGLSEALAKATLQSTALSEELDNTAHLLEEDKKHTAEYERADWHGDPGEVDKLKADLKAAKETAK